MSKITVAFQKVPKRIKDSMEYALLIFGGLSTFFSILGVSLADCITTLVMRMVVFVVAFLAVLGIVYLILGAIYKNKVSTQIKGTPVCITYGNIFNEDGWKVIGCDTHFDTRADDVVISKKSLHGQLITNHAVIKDFKASVKKDALRLSLEPDNGLYKFPLGNVIPYQSKKDNSTYLLLAAMELDDQHEAHTNMAKYEGMLMKMWKELNRVYAGNDIVLPLIGDGISRFDDGPQSKKELLKCILCTLNSSGVQFKSKIKIVLYGNAGDIPLYDYKNIFLRRHIMSNRTANYTAFYVKTPFSESNLGANATPDFLYYNQLRAWKASDSSFPFVDAHGKTYNVRDDSEWETLKNRLHERLSMSKNIILFLSENTKNSDALREEISYGIVTKGLPVIVVYPDYKEKTDIASSSGLKQQIKDLWDKLPAFRDNMDKVATMHIPYKKELIKQALSNTDFTVQGMKDTKRHYYI